MVLNDHIPQAGDSLTSRSEFQWDGDQKWGMGDYRLPNQMTTALNGSFIKPSTWPNKGIDRVLNGNVCIVLCRFSLAMNGDFADS